MAATPPVHVSDISNLQPLIINAPYIAEEDHAGANIPLDADDRSSSLSEIEDRGVTEHIGTVPSPNGSEGGDTEAETERLEVSPEKLRLQQNVVLTTTSYSHTDGQRQVPEPNTVPNGQHYGN